MLSSSGPLLPHQESGGDCPPPPASSGQGEDPEIQGAEVQCKLPRAGRVLVRDTVAQGQTTGLEGGRAASHPGCVTLGTSPALSGPQYPHQ